LKSSFQSSPGTPSISAMTAIVIGAATSCTKSQAPRSPASSRIRRVIR
jgi:hypothetical protein